MEDEILINRVAESGIITINLEEHYPKRDIAEFDIKDHLFHGLILKEKDFRATLKEFNWDVFHEKWALVYCSTDAIIPVWAYMLVSSYLKPVAHDIFVGTREQYLDHHFRQALSSLDMSQYQEKRIVVKGCSDKPVPPSAYGLITAMLQPYAQSIMYGEPCSTVPIFKRPRKL